MRHIHRHVANTRFNVIVNGNISRNHSIRMDTIIADCYACPEVYRCRPGEIGIVNTDVFQCLATDTESGMTSVTIGFRIVTVKPSFSNPVP